MNIYTQGKALHSQTREVIANIYRVCDEEGTNNFCQVPLKRKLERAALYAGVSTKA